MRRVEYIRQPSISEIADLQQRFALCVGELILFCYEKGWAFTLGEGYIGDSIDKPHEDTPHVRHGNHFKRLAIDLNLWVDGNYITGDHSAWYVLGAYWKLLDPDARWGGDFSHRDFNHFSFTYKGVA